MSVSNHSLSRRDFLRLAGIATAGATLAACGVTPAQPPAATQGPVQLVYQDWRTEWFPGLAQEMLAKFNSEHPNIRVFYTPDPDNLEVKMPADMAAGIAPDVMAGCCDFFPAWANAGYLLDLRPCVKADLDQATIDDWSPAQYQALFTRDGKQFGLPKYHGALALYYNKDLFDAAGVDYPSSQWTYDDYLEAMKKLTLRKAGEKAHHHRDGILVHRRAIALHPGHCLGPCILVLLAQGIADPLGIVTDGAGFHDKGLGVVLGLLRSRTG